MMKQWRNKQHQNKKQRQLKKKSQGAQSLIDAFQREKV
jgi:hypothetical protein